MGKKVAAALFAAFAAGVALACVFVASPVGHSVQQAFAGPVRRLQLRLLRENAIRGPARGPVPPDSDRLFSKPAHPLDPLTVEEMRVAREVCLDAGLAVDGKAHFHGLELHEPPKMAVLQWQKGNELPPREAYIVTWKDGQTREIIVDLIGRKVVSNKEYMGTGRPMLGDGEWNVANMAPKSYAPFIESMAKRGLPAEDTFCAPFTAGWYPEGDKFDETRRRVVRMTCFNSAVGNFWMEPVEGIVMYVDLDTKEIFNYVDEGVKPNGPAKLTAYTKKDLSNKLDPPFKPISIEQPQGVNFKVDGYQISWDKWQFHAAPNARAGLMIAQVKFNDTFTGAVRDIMYQGHVAEMFVPYQDPGQPWFFKTFMDVGEYGFGNSAGGLVPLNDCPANAHYVDGVLADPEGNPKIVPNMMCIFERYAGDTAWRHTEIACNNEDEVRPKVTLVARQAATVGNYDYTIDWEFQTDGLIRVTVTMSGMVTVKSMVPSNLNEVTENGEGIHGTFVSEHTVAVNHDHFINFRLDLDVDGPKNSFLEGRLVTKKVPEGSSWRKSVWEVEKFVPKTELEAQFNASAQLPAEYYVINKGSKTRLGNTRSYKLVPRTSSAPMNSEDDPPQLRGAWSRNSIWVTPFDKEERWPGGNFPNQQQGEDTLATWTLRDRPVDDTDVVVWYNLGYHHAPVQEDFPVMPSTLGGFDIKPANFFEANPALFAQPFPDTEQDSARLFL